MLMKILRKAVNRIRGRLDFSAAHRDADKAHHVAKRPPKRKRRR